MPSWGLDDLRDNNTIADLAYDGRELTINSVTSFEAQGLLGSILRLHPPRNSGTVTMELRAPVDVVRLLQAPRDALHALVHDAPHRRLGGGAQRRSAQGAAADRRHRRAAHRRAPQRQGARRRHAASAVAARRRARGRARAARASSITSIVDGALAWEHGRVQLSGEAGAARRAAADASAASPSSTGGGWSTASGWRDGALDIDVDVPGYALGAAARPAAAAARHRRHRCAGAPQLRGTFAAPDLRVVADGRDVGLAHGALRAARRRRRACTTRAGASTRGGREAGGAAALRVAGELPRDWDAPMRLSIDARALDVGFLGALWEEIGDVGGRLDAHVARVGHARRAAADGRARLDGGRFGFRGDARRYQAALDLRVDGDAARLDAAVRCAAAAARSTPPAARASTGCGRRSWRWRRTRTPSTSAYGSADGALRRRLRARRRSHATTSSTAQLRADARQPSSCPSSAGSARAEELGGCPTCASTTRARAATPARRSAGQGRVHRRCASTGRSSCAAARPISISAASSASPSPAARSASKASSRRDARQRRAPRQALRRSSARSSPSAARPTIPSCTCA